MLMTILTILLITSTSFAKGMEYANYMGLMESDDSLPIDDYLSLPDLEDDIPNELSQELDDLSTN